jgi:oxygen-dependent protoporphyrinogen oxidase
VTDVVVIGGGIAGLCAAYGLSVRDAGVTLIEASSRLGGQIETERTGGFVIEHGAEGFVARSRAVPELCRELGIADSLISQLTKDTLVLRGEGLEPLAPGEAASLLGFQVESADMGQGILTLRAGMGHLVDVLCDRLNGRVEFRRRVRAMELNHTGSSWCVSLEDGEMVTADAVVVAVPRRPASRLLTRIAGDAVRAVTETRAVSSVTVSLAYRAGTVQDTLEGTGFVVSGMRDDGVGLRACTFCTSKFPQRAPAGWVLLRLFFRPTLEGLTEWGDDRWGCEATDALRPVLGAAQSPVHTWVSRWPDALPRFSATDAALVEELAGRLLAQGPVQLAGAAFHGVGIDAAVRSGLDAAGRLCGEPTRQATEGNTPAG